MQDETCRLGSYESQLPPECRDDSLGSVLSPLDGRTQNRLEQRCDLACPGLSFQNGLVENRLPIDGNPEDAVSSGFQLQF
jgi:hypothetical protein